MSAEGSRGPGEYEERKLFVGGLSWDTEESSLRKYFEQFGEVEEVSVKKDKDTHKPRGFGFVTYKDGSCIANVLSNHHHHELDGKRIDPKLATAKSAPTPTRESKDNTKVFVGGIPPLAGGETIESVTKELRDLFENSQYSVVEVEIKRDQSDRDKQLTERHRGFGFVTFASVNDAATVCQAHFIPFKGKNVEVKKADPRQAKPSGGGRYLSGSQMASYPQQQWDGSYGGGGSYPYGSGSEYGNYYYGQGYPPSQSGGSGGGYDYTYSHGSSRGDASAANYSHQGGYPQSYDYGAHQGGHAGFGTQPQQQSSYYSHPTS